MKLAMRAQSAYKKVTLMATAFVLAVSSLTAAVPFILSEKASAIAVVSTSDYSGNLAQAVAAADAGGVVNVDGGIFIDSSVVVTKPLTIKGQGNPVVTVANNVPALNAISIQSSGVTVDGLNFKSAWNIGDGNVVRALGVSSYPNVTIINNTFENLRQPAYINANASGVVANNKTSNTKGWVVESGSDFAFTNNSWGENVLDIAIIGTALNNYTDAEVVGMSNSNNNATVEQQFGGVNRLSDAYVTPTNTLGRTGDNGSDWNPYTSVQDGLNRIVDGGTVHLADGNYYGTANITKNGTKLVGTTNSRDTVKIYATPSSGQAGIFANGVNDITIQNLGVYGNDFTAGGALIKLNDGSNARIQNVAVKDSTTATGININTYANVVIEGIFVNNVAKDGISVVAQQNTTTNVSENITIANTSIAGAQWSALAFNTKAGVYTGSIKNVTLTNVSTQYGLRGLYVDGAGGTVTSPGSTKLVLNNFYAGDNTNEYINNEQTADIDARSSRINIGNGVVVPVNQMTQAQYEATLLKIKDKVNKNPTNANYGYVQLVNVTAPTLTLKTAGGAQLTNQGTTTQKDVVASWTKPNGVSTFTYKYWNSIPGNQYKQGSPYVVSGLTDLSRAGSFTEGVGTHYMQVDAVDVYGTVASSNIFEITFDNVNPTVVYASVTPNPAKSIDGTVNLNLTLKDTTTNIASAQYTLYNNATDEVIVKNVPISSSYDGKEVTANALIDVMNLPIGEYRIQLHFKDAAGNQGKRTLSFEVNNDEKTVAVTTNTIDTSTRTPTVSGTAFWTADSTKPAEGQKVTVIVGGVEYLTTVNTDGTWSIVTGELSDGAYSADVIVSNDQDEDVSGVATQSFTIALTPATNPGGNPGTGGNNGNTGGNTGNENPDGTLVQQPPVTLTDDDSNNALNGNFPLANFGAQQVLGQSTTNNDTNTDNEGTPEVEGVSTERNVAQAVDSDSNQGRFMGIAWYWWLLILAAIIGLIWWIVAAVRRRNAEQN